MWRSEGKFFAFSVWAKDKRFHFRFWCNDRQILPSKAD